MINDGATAERHPVWKKLLNILRKGDTAAEVVTKTVIRCSAGDIGQPVIGRVIPYTEIADPTFATGTLGQGVGIEPEDGAVYAPYSGEVSSIANGNHAVGVTGPGGMEVLIHVGVDTVDMKGDGFDVLVKEGDRVRKGQKIMIFDREKIKAAAHPDTVAVLLTNSGDYDGVKFGDAI